MTETSVHVFEAKLRSLTPSARNRLRRHGCGWCNALMHQPYCCAFDEKCGVDLRMRRAARCLMASRSKAIRRQADALWPEGEGAT
jgi:hypothetical protein